MWAPQNYILHIHIPQLFQYRKWFLVLICMLVLTRVERVVVTPYSLAIT
jgi:hypothetical protein